MIAEPARNEAGETEHSNLIIHSQAISDTSRLSGVGIEKFLEPGERLVHVTPGWIRYGNQRRHAYVTNKRVIFYGRQGVMLGLIKNDRLDEMFLNQIGN